MAILTAEAVAAVKAADEQLNKVFEHSRVTIPDDQGQAAAHAARTRKRKFPQDTAHIEAAALLYQPAMEKLRESLDSRTGIYQSKDYALDILDQASKLPTTPLTLGHSGLSYAVARYRKHPHEEVQAQARELVGKWKATFQQLSARQGIPRA